MKRGFKMENCNKAIKEWNAVVEALGKGKQSILIRKYASTNREFLLYPTFSYAIKDDYLTMFKEDYQPFVEENVLPLKRDDEVQIKYYASVEKILEKSVGSMGKLNNMHMWTNAHVKSYLENKKGFVWLLRVYELEEPIFAEKNMGMVFANLKTGASLDGMEPVISDDEFKEIESKL